MEYESKVPVEEDTEDSKIFYRNSRITQILNIVFNEPKNEKELQSILLNFWRKYENCISVSEDFCEFDVLCMYALDYAYKNNGPTNAAVSRSLYFYLKVINLSLEGRNTILNFTDSSFVKNLKDLTNFNSAKGEDILTDALMKSFLGENCGLSQFLVKFGLIEFPSEANEKSRKIVRKLVKFFNSTYASITAENLPEEERISIQFDDLFKQMQQNKNVNFRRLIIIFCSICIIAEYRAFDELEIRYDEKEYISIFKRLCYRQSRCLDLFIEMTAESSVRFKDVNEFLQTILNGQLSQGARMSLLEASRKVFCEMPDYYNPRSLKHIIRSKIRECVQNSALLPKGVDQLPIPVALKDFITSEEKDIWETLKSDQRIHYLKRKLLT